MLLTLLAAAAVQSGQPAVATPTAPASAQTRAEQLACPSTGKLIARSAGQVRNAFHTLNQEPDAAMIKPVARNYCEPSDVIRTNVSDRNPRPTVTPVPPRIAR
ncbi:MAG TPA: hypothetical protein VFN88_10280 [Caulobacteraceae bacterium]|nr:hypothetical protein [Caulobacteraceae bacterium]